MKKHLALVILCTFLWQSSALAVGDSDQSEKPRFVNFTILGALVAPTKSDGTTWDATLKAKGKARSLLSELILPGSSFVTSSAIEAISEMSQKGSAAPDVVGFVVQTGTTTGYLSQVAGIRMTLADRKTITKDSYMPRFETGYSGWPIFKDTRFRIELWDKDLVHSDNIAVVELTYDDILLAIKHGKPVWINVSDQSMNQLLCILISASNALDNQHPKMNGFRWQGKI